MLAQVELAEKDVRPVVLAVEGLALARHSAPVHEVPLEAVLGHAVRRIQRALHVPDGRTGVIRARLDQLLDRQRERGCLYHLFSTG